MKKAPYKPNWEDAPSWAKHLWRQSDNRFSWTSSKRRNCKALWTTDSPGAEFHFWPECWEYQEPRPKGPPNAQSAATRKWYV